MSIRNIISEISREIGSLEVIQYSRSADSKIKNRDLLAGAFITEDEYIEIKGASGLEIEIKINQFLKYEKLNNNVYRISNNNIELLVRLLDIENI